MRRSKRGTVRGSLLAEVPGWGMDEVARSAAAVPAVALDMGTIMGSGGSVVAGWWAVDRALTLAERIGGISLSIMWLGEKPITSRPYGGRW